MHSHRFQALAAAWLVLLQLCAQPLAMGLSCASERGVGAESCCCAPEVEPEPTPLAGSCCSQEEATPAERAPVESEEDACGCLLTPSDGAPVPAWEGLRGSERWAPPLPAPAPASAAWETPIRAARSALRSEPPRRAGPPPRVVHCVWLL